MSNTSSSVIPAGRVAWYVTERFYVDAKGASFDEGYFPDIKGLDLPMLSGSGPAAEKTAHFTFSADPFPETTRTNGDVSLSISPPGRWHLYYNLIPCGDFDAPGTFAKGQRIATFARDGTSAA
ncbi:hypothetical protein [Tateyamaria sp. ANG-S1]|uniref:hypothetical protein n=1 Tax=Tateyamaria sp. ANG-S1 TaxID=1577905 RepID=UPI00057F3D6E|nr:hypothetical protein [Tateyamaria sp. ANG-S1]KIC51552.1 hypothetical protein RA29_01765 [Tateyamaria sp. ANG-S1]